MLLINHNNNLICHDSHRAEKPPVELIEIIAGILIKVVETTTKLISQWDVVDASRIVMVDVG